MEHGAGSEMEAAGTSDKGAGDLSSSSVEQDFQLDLMGCLDSNEKLFQAKMYKIFLKYNHPFEDDLIVDIETLTYDTLEGPRPWEGRYQPKIKKPKYKKRSKVKESADNVNTCSETCISSGEADNGCTTEGSSSSLVETSEAFNHDINLSVCNKTFVISGENPKVCNRENTLVKFKQENSPLVKLCDMKLGEKYIADVDVLVHFNESVIPKLYAEECTEDQGNIKFSPVRNQMEFQDHDGREDTLQKNLEHRSPKATSPLKLSISTQLKRFLGRHHRSLNSDHTKVFNRKMALKEKADSERDYADDEDSDFSDTASDGFFSFYPEKIEYLSRLMDIPCKKQAATNILRYYRRHVWCANKHKINIKRAIRISRHSKVPLNPITSGEVHCINDSMPDSDRLWQNVQGSLLHTSGISENRETALDSRNPHATSCLQNTKPNMVEVSILSQTITKSPEKTFFCMDSSVTPRPESWSKSYSFYAQSPPPCNASFMENTQTSDSPSKLHSMSWLNKRQLKNEERKLTLQSASKCQVRAEWPQQMEKTLKRRHSFSTFPLLQSPIKNYSKYDSAFENLYRELVLQARTKIPLPKGRTLNTVTYVSETVGALVNSPVSNRGKRVASDEYLPLAKFKRHRSMGDSLVESLSNPQSPRVDYVANWCPQWKEHGLTPRTTSGWLGVLQSKYAAKQRSNEKPALPNSTIHHSPCSLGSIPHWRYTDQSNFTCNSPKIPQRINASTYRKLNYK